MNVSAPFIARPVATSLLAIAVVLTGTLGYINLPVSALPEVDFPTLKITTQFPGAAPDTVASLVTTPLEQQFGQISGLTMMTSTSSFGISQITLQFDLLRDIDAAALDVQAAINAAGGVLPRDLPYPPTYAKVNPADQPILTLALTSETLPITKVDDAADTVLAQRLAEVLGVGLVSIQGGQKPAVRVRVDPRKLASFGLSMEDVRLAISRATVNQPKGSFDGPKQSFTINANDQLTSAAQFKPLVLSYFNGAPVRLQDVGDAINGVENNKTAAWYNGKQAVIVDIQRQPGANIINTVDRIKTLLPNIQRSIPAGVQLNVLADRTETIRASVDDVKYTLVLTIFLVVGVIFVFLGKVWATVIPGVALPLSIVGTFGIMALSGYSLDNLSLMALTISAGFVVDDAIVMIENIVRYIEAGETPLEAAYKGAKQIGFTVISLTVSLIAVFIPLLFMSGIIGRLFREFAMTLTYAIVVSAIISLTLTPMMCAKLLSAEPKHEGPGPKKDHRNLFVRVTDSAFNAVLKLYEWTLKIVLNHQATTLLIALATLVGTVVLYIVVPKGFLPQQDTGLIVVTTDADQTVSFDAMKELQAKLAAIAQNDPDVAGVDSFIGTGTINTTPNTGRITVALKPHSERAASANEIIERLSERFAQVDKIEASLQSQQDIQIGSRVSRTQFQFTLIDSDVAELDEWSRKLADKLKTLPYLQGVTTDQVNGGLLADLTIDRDQAARLGVLPQTIDDVLYDAFGQRQVATIYSQLNQYHVILEASPEFQLGPESLSVLYVPAAVNVTGLKSGSGPSGGATNSLNVAQSPTNPSLPQSNASIGPSIGSSLASPIPVAGTPDSSNALPSNTSARPSGTSVAGISTGAGATTTSGSFGSGGLNSANSGAGGGKGGGPVLNTAPAATIGIQVPLSNFVQLKRTKAPLAINHQAQFSSVTISFNLAKGESLSKAVEDIKAAEREINMPDTVEGSFSGEAAEFQSSLAGEPYLLAAAIVAVYIVLGVLYESLIHPFTIISTLPSAGIGALLALRMFGFDLSIIGIIGIVLLIGIVKKNAIMMIDFALEAEREEKLPPREAIFKACLLRFRPIMMTTAAALLGAVPLALSSGPGSELRRPLGVAIIGGLLLSQVLTLYTTPVIYLAMDWLRDKVLTLLGRNTAKSSPEHHDDTGHPLEPALAAAAMPAALPAPAQQPALPPPPPPKGELPPP